MFNTTKGKLFILLGSLIVLVAFIIRSKALLPDGVSGFILGIGIALLLIGIFSTRRRS